MLSDSPTHHRYLNSHFISKESLVAHCYSVVEEFRDIVNRFYATDICKNGSNNYYRCDISCYTKSDVGSHFNRAA